jgi:hypothetical protein
LKNVWFGKCLIFKESYEGPGERGEPYAVDPKLASKAEQSINKYGKQITVIPENSSVKGRLCVKKLDFS